MPWKLAFGFPFPGFALCKNAIQGIHLRFPGPGLVARKPQVSAENFVKTETPAIDCPVWVEPYAR